MSLAEKDRKEIFSPASVILVPLLDALNWKGDENKLKQSMNGLEYDMDTDGLVDTMAQLNFQHKRIKKVRGSMIDKRLLPVLLVNGTVYTVIIKMDDENALVFDSVHGCFNNQKVTELSGDLFSFKYIGELNDTLLNQEGNWFNKLIFRFKKSFKMLIVLTLFMTLLDLLIPLFVILIYDQIGTNGTPEGLLILLAGVLIYFTSTSLLDYYRGSIINYISTRMGNVIAQQTFKKLLYLSPSYTETASVSSQINRMKDFENLKRFTNSGIFLNLLELIFSLIYVIAIFVLGGWIGIIPIVTFIIVLILGSIMKPFHKIKMEQSSLSKADQQSNLLEILKNSQVIKTSSMKDHWIERSKEINSKSITRYFSQASFVSSSNNLVYFITNASVMAVVYGGVLQVFDDKMTMGALIGVILLYWKVLSSIRGASSLFVQVNGLQKSIAQINRFMKLPQDTNLKANMVLTKEIKGHVVFNDVSIRYNKTSKAALVNVNFSVKPGNILGISGHDGSGKTTILKLILGMYLPQGGRIIIDDLNIKQLEPLTLRRFVSYAPERDMIFTGSIRSNFKNMNPSIDDEKIYALANQTNLSQYLEDYQFDLDTVFTDRMLQDLSPSFKKIFSLTRLLARDVNLYLIDEPENHLDKYELEKVISMIKRLAFYQKTVIVTSKNEDILNACHSILNLNQGRGKIVERG